MLATAASVGAMRAASAGRASAGRGGECWPCNEGAGRGGGVAASAGRGGGVAASAGRGGGVAASACRGCEQAAHGPSAALSLCFQNLAATATKQVASR